MDPEVERAESFIDGGRIRLTGRRHYVVECLIRCRIRAASDSQRQIVGYEYHSGQHTYQQHDTSTRLEVVASYHSPSIGRAAHHGVAKHGQRDGNPDGRRVRGNREVCVDETESSRGQCVSVNHFLYPIQTVELWDIYQFEDASR